MARPAMADSMKCRLSYDFPPEELWPNSPSTPPAPRAAVMTRLPFAPAQPPGSRRAWYASAAPAVTAAARELASPFLERLLLP